MFSIYFSREGIVDVYIELYLVFVISLRNTRVYYYNCKICEPFFSLLSLFSSHHHFNSLSLSLFSLISLEQSKGFHTYHSGFFIQQDKPASLSMPHCMILWAYSAACFCVDFCKNKLWERRKKYVVYHSWLFQQLCL
jgi:uncharacterized BrkB/YihY/UPF0761 family membrane protein